MSEVMNVGVMNVGQSLHLPVCICGEDALEESLLPDSDVLLFHEDCDLTFSSLGR